VWIRPFFHRLHSNIASSLLVFSKANKSSQPPI
jgi:hypothetical protein